ncbi:MAG: cryptochrome/photolyase family protein [Rickettsiales bacterium]|nr:cryptochrome/photolyase family protein [Rickettsiales bacterium]
MGNLIVILWDQLSHTISSLKDFRPNQDNILICETIEDATYVKHHKKKLAFILSCMRHFKLELEKKHYKTHYTKLDDDKNSGSIEGEIKKLLNTLKINKIIVTHPGEYRVLEKIKKWQKTFGVNIEIREDNRFLCSLDEFQSWSKTKKQLRMEYFYREMRKKLNVLMKNGQPIGEKWNYDCENRQSPNLDIKFPNLYKVKRDNITDEIIKLVQSKFNAHFGDLESFYFAVNRKDALKALTQFISKKLTQYGKYQDAMIENQPVMFHSHISMYLNIGLLDPLECIIAAEKAYKKGKAPLNSVEGFIRQILGWREFIRGIYWLKMPEYKKMNYLDNKKHLPNFYWTGKTDMNCLKQCIQETKKNAYAHHIQRLMILGNFALLIGVAPEYLNEWYLIVYADAFEWVELPNVSGMVLFADGGFLASKPYISTGNYINKMSNYCKSCKYNVKIKETSEACPFNYLYWSFLMKHNKKFAGNSRMHVMYNILNKMNNQQKELIFDNTRRFLKCIHK